MPLVEHIKTLDLIKLSIAFSVQFAFLIIVFALVYKEIPETNKDILIHTVGILEGAIIGIVSYYWGSSKSSDKKTEILDKQLNK